MTPGDLLGLLPKGDCRPTLVFTSADAEEQLSRTGIPDDRWVRFHAMYNWRYAAVRDNARRLHPLMLSFDELSLADQAKDDYAWELISSLI